MPSKMKVTPEHRQQMLILIKGVLKHPIQDYIESYARAGLSPMRQRWDALYATPSKERTAWFDEVYKYADDTHVDTCLRWVIRELSK